MQIIIKRFFDFACALIGLIILIPFFVIIAILIKMDSSGPIFFLQERTGKDNKSFKIYKFRTMTVLLDNEAILNSLKNKKHELTAQDLQITKIGHYLRELAIDELPQLINILKGEMSFIGPRPTLKYQTDQYDEFQKQRLTVLPGITGWAQVNGRNELAWADRIKDDVWYIKNWSLWLDIKIIFKTIKILIYRKGIFGKDGKNDAFIQ